LSLKSSHAITTITSWCIYTLFVLSTRISSIFSITFIEIFFFFWMVFNISDEIKKERQRNQNLCMYQLILFHKTLLDNHKYNFHLYLYNMHFDHMNFLHSHHYIHYNLNWNNNKLNQNQKKKKIKNDKPMQENPSP